MLGTTRGGDTITPDFNGKPARLQFRVDIVEFPAMTVLFPDRMTVFPTSVNAFTERMNAFTNGIAVAGVLLPIPYERQVLRGRHVVDGLHLAHDPRSQLLVLECQTLRP